ncbi:fumarylacetoacetate hydrolase family protein, partial [Bacteroides fragilis]|nr:fumarylacetoacetate hydrolase family protein [Bacteroides fragilis]
LSTPRRSTPPRCACAPGLMASWRRRVPRLRRTSTASNDLGLYDYRAQDKGSNTRSKSRDGYTPIGPMLIDAQTIDPASLRLRTWVNGELAQEGTSSEKDL